MSTFAQARNLMRYITEDPTELDNLKTYFMEYMEGANESALFMKHEQLCRILERMDGTHPHFEFTAWALDYITDRIAGMITDQEDSYE